METYLLTWNPNDSAVDKTALEWRRLRAGTRPGNVVCKKPFKPVVRQTCPAGCRGW